MNATAKYISINATVLSLFLLAGTQTASAQSTMRGGSVQGASMRGASMEGTGNYGSAMQGAATQPSPFQQLMSGLNPANWRLPNFRGLLPGNDEKARIKKKKDSLFEEVTKTASNSWTRTKEASKKLNPVNYFPASSRTPTAGQRQQENKPGFFQSLFAPAPSERESTTVTDFLRQSRPNP